MSTKIWYFKKEFSKEFLCGDIPSIATLQETHAVIHTLDITDMEKIFIRMQENWAAPSGIKCNCANTGLYGFHDCMQCSKRRTKILTDAGVAHTSMSMGDVIELPDGTCHVCAMMGFKEIS
jgi:predicted transglutaminase-like cysteine proteinase